MRHDFNTLHLLWSIRNIPSSEITHQGKLILFTLLSCTGNENLSWYSQQSLAEMCSICETSIKKYLKQLVHKKFIIVEVPCNQGRGKTNQYTLNIDYIMTYSNLKKGSHINPFMQERGRSLPRKGSRDDYERGRHATTKKENEELKEEGATRLSEEARLRHEETERERREFWEKNAKYYEKFESHTSH